MRTQLKSDTTTQEVMMFRSLVRGVLVLVLLVLPLPAFALTDYLEGTAVNSWRGAYAVQTDGGSVNTGIGQFSPLFDGVTLPTTTVILNISGTADLSSFGSLSYGVQPVWALAGDPSPTTAVLAKVEGGTIRGRGVDAAWLVLRF